MTREKAIARMAWDQGFRERMKTFADGQPAVEPGAARRPLGTLRFALTCELLAALVLAALVVGGRIVGH